MSEWETHFALIGSTRRAEEHCADRTFPTPFIFKLHSQYDSLDSCILLLPQGTPAGRNHIIIEVLK